MVKVKKIPSIYNNTRKDHERKKDGEEKEKKKKKKKSQRLKEAVTVVWHYLPYEGEKKVMSFISHLLPQNSHSSSNDV